jgi:hypothetical protein
VLWRPTHTLRPIRDRHLNSDRARQAQRIKRFRCSRGTLCAEHRNCGYTLCDAQSGALVARFATALTHDAECRRVVHSERSYLGTAITRVSQQREARPETTRGALSPPEFAESETRDSGHIVGRVPPTCIRRAMRRTVRAEQPTPAHRYLLAGRCHPHPDRHPTAPRSA